MNNQKETSDEQKTSISRQEALRKMGKYAAVTAIGTFIVLSPKQSQAMSLPCPNTNPPWCNTVASDGEGQGNNSTPQESRSIWGNKASSNERRGIWNNDRSGRDDR